MLLKSYPTRYKMTALRYFKKPAEPQVAPLVISGAQRGRLLVAGVEVQGR
jgi:hypothetical protein